MSEVAPATMFGFSTAAMRPRAAREAYRALYAVGADFSPDDERFGAAMTSRRFLRMIVHDRRLRGVRHMRDARRVRRDDFSHFTATLCLSGEIHADEGGGYRRLRPGEILLLDMSRPTRNHMEDGHILTVALGREVLDGVAGDPRRLHGQVLDPARAHPLARHLVGLTTSRHVDSSTDLAVRTTEDLLRDVVGAPYDGVAARQAARRRHEALGIVEAELDQADLDAARLAARLGVSRATLYRLFEPWGGVRQHILARRLSRLRDLLVADPATGVATLVARAGIASESHASRAFLDRFGTRPGAFRRMVHELAAPARVALAMALWTDGLR